MLLLNPRLVKFGSAAWENITAVVIDRAATRLVLDWSDLGPHAVLADVPEQRITLRILQEVANDDVDAPRPGEQGELVFYTAPAAGERGRKKVSTTAIITQVSHELSLKRGAVRTVTLVAISGDGAADPIIITASEDGQA